MSNIKEKPKKNIKLFDKGVIATEKTKEVLQYIKKKSEPSDENANEQSIDYLKDVHHVISKHQSKKIVKKHKKRLNESNNKIKEVRRTFIPNKIKSKFQPNETVNNQYNKAKNLARKKLVFKGKKTFKKKPKKISNFFNMLKVNLLKIKSMILVLGVFGVIPCIETLVEDKIGITQSIVKTNENTEFPLISQKMTPMQRASMQRMVNETYELFVARCATGRHTTCDSIKSIAEGRVWDGISAKEIGLVDEFGNTQAAIKWVANQAGISDYDIITGPDENFKLSNYIFQYMETRVENRLESEANPLYKYHKEIAKILSREPIQCLMEPLEIR